MFFSQIQFELQRVPVIQSKQLYMNITSKGMTALILGHQEAMQYETDLIMPLVCYLVQIQVVLIEHTSKLGKEWFGRFCPWVGEANLKSAFMALLCQKLNVESWLRLDRTTPKGDEKLGWHAKAQIVDGDFLKWEFNKKLF